MRAGRGEFVLWDPKDGRVARALCTKPKLLLLDEPSSGLNPEETEDLAFWIEDINEELGITTVMVEHDMKLVSTVSDRVMAMADGKMLLLELRKRFRRILKYCVHIWVIR